MLQGEIGIIQKNNNSTETDIPKENNCSRTV